MSTSYRVWAITLTIANWRAPERPGERRALVEVDDAIAEVGQDVDTVADLRVTEWVIGGFHTRDRDKVAGRSSRT